MASEFGSTHKHPAPHVNRARISGVGLLLKAITGHFPPLSCTVSYNVGYGDGPKIRTSGLMPDEYLESTLGLYSALQGWGRVSLLLGVALFQN